MWRSGSADALVLPALLRKLILVLLEDGHRLKREVFVLGDLSTDAHTYVSVTEARETRSDTYETHDDDLGTTIVHSLSYFALQSFCRLLRTEMGSCRVSFRDWCRYEGFTTHLGTATRSVSMNSDSPVVKSSLCTMSPSERVARLPLQAVDDPASVCRAQGVTTDEATHVIFLCMAVNDPFARLYAWSRPFWMLSIEFISFVSASSTSATLPESPHLPRSHFHPDPSDGKIYSSKGRSFTCATYNGRTA
jgi:hypothetical protein